MNFIQLLQQEWNQELAITQKMLNAIPENFDWKPHEKSMSLGRLATHVAEIPEWMAVTLDTDVLDFAKGYTPNKPATKAEVLALFDKMSKKSVESLSNLTEAKMDETWTMRNGDVVYFTLPKAVVMRQFVFSHIVHHRAQLGVYLRILGIPVPGTYGPSADES
ncbi:MAG TPA: DinB family protein [Ferruginibacter sp.]|nr:DinB family protein [Ferruginibacter sp.]